MNIVSNWKNQLVKGILEYLDQAMLMESGREFEGLGLENLSDEEFEEAVREIDWVAQALKNSIKNFEPIPVPEEFDEYKMEEGFDLYGD